MLPFIRVTHTGVYPSGRPNTSSILLSDVSYTGQSQQDRKSPVYVPAGGFIDLPLSTDVAFSYENGDIANYVLAGYLTAVIIGLLPEAPIDGNIYGRKNAAWEVVTSGPAGEEWRMSGTASGTVDLLSLPYAINTGPDEIEVHMLLYRVTDQGESGIMETLGVASRGAGNLEVSDTRRRADNLPGSQDLELAVGGGTNLIVRATLGGNAVTYRAIIRRRTWSDYA